MDEFTGSSYDDPEHLMRLKREVDKYNEKTSKYKDQKQWRICFMWRGVKYCLVEFTACSMWFEDFQTTDYPLDGKKVVVGKIDEEGNFTANDGYILRVRIFASTDRHSFLDLKKMDVKGPSEIRVDYTWVE